MKKILTALTAAIVISTAALAMSGPADALWGYRGFGYHGLGRGFGGYAYRGLGWGFRGYGYRGLWGYGGNGYPAMSYGYGGTVVPAAIYHPAFGNYGCGW